MFFAPGRRRGCRRGGGGDRPARGARGRGSGVASAGRRSRARMRCGAHHVRCAACHSAAAFRRLIDPRSGRGAATLEPGFREWGWRLRKAGGWGCGKGVGKFPQRMGMIGPDGRTEGERWEPVACRQGIRQRLPPLRGDLPMLPLTWGFSTNAGVPFRGSREMKTPWGTPRWVVLGIHRSFTIHPQGYPQSLWITLLGKANGSGRNGPLGEPWPGSISGRGPDSRFSAGAPEPLFHASRPRGSRIRGPGYLGDSIQGRGGRWQST